VTTSRHRKKKEKNRVASNVVETLESNSSNQLVSAFGFEGVGKRPQGTQPLFCQEKAPHKQVQKLKLPRGGKDE